jgi:hypothetical protein
VSSLSGIIFGTASEMSTKPSSASELLNRINNGQRRRLYLEDFYYSYKCSQIDTTDKHTMSIQEQEDEQSDEGDVKDLKLSGGMDLESDTNRSENEDVKPEKGSFSHIEGKIEK